MAERRRRVGRTKSAIRPARVRSDTDRFGDRRRERFRIRSWCLRRSDSATMERAPPGPSRRARVAMKRMKRTTRLRIAESSQDGNPKKSWAKQQFASHRLERDESRWHFLRVDAPDGREPSF